MNIVQKHIDRDTRKALKGNYFGIEDPTICKTYRQYRIVVRAITREYMRKPVIKTNSTRDTLYDKIWKSADKFLL